MNCRRWSWVLALLLLPQLANADDFRLMVIGDSITEGQGAPPGFRDDLHTLLNAEPGLSFTFVGSTGTPPLQGHFLGGRAIEDFYPPAFGYGWGNGSFDTTPDMAAPNTPHIVAIHLGTNDLNSQPSPYIPYSFDHGQTFTHTQLGELADYLLFLLQWQDGTLSTDLSRVVLSLNIPMQARSLDLKQWADGIIAMAEDFGEGTVTGTPFPIALADHYHRFLSNPDLFTFGPGDWMVDALHPNNAGYVQMADIYHRSVVAAAIDSTAPSSIVDLQVVEVDTTRVRLAFTAVGDDSLVGRAFRYDLRVSTEPFGAQTFAFAPQATDEPDPRLSWEPDTLEVTDLVPGVTYHFAIKAVDDAGNRSEPSGVVTATTISTPTVVLTLREGLNGYFGSEDTEIVDRYLRENNGGNTSISVGRTGTEPFASPDPPLDGLPSEETLVPDIFRSFVRFNLQAIPAGAQILDARLRCYNYARDSTQPVEIGAFRVTKHWVEGTRVGWIQQSGTACWNYAQLNVLAWSTPGAAAASDNAQNGDPNFDRYATPEDVTTVSGVNTWYEWDLTNAVVQWRNGTWDNEGVTIQGITESANGRRRFYSSEYTSNHSRRPTLVITYAPPVINTAPVAQVGGPYQGEEDLPIQFDGTSSFDPEGQAITYAWDFGDGGTATEAMPTHVYADPGAYPVALIVHDGQLQSAPDTTTATIGVSTAVGGEAAAPLLTRLIGATPNPVALTGALRYDLAMRAHVRLRIVDVQGRIVRKLVDEVQEPGEYRAQWNGADQAGRRLPAGIYFGEFAAAGVKETRKLILLP
jgi:lysophospholipase L1-like esterase